MKGVFWSPVHGQSATTSNLLALSLICGMKYKQNCLITQTHFNYNNLEAPLIERNSKSADGFFQDVGIDALVRNFKAERLSFETVENCCISLDNTKVRLLPGTTKTNREAFDYEVGKLLPTIFTQAHEFYDAMFIDCNPGMNELSKKLMEEADITIVNFSQNLEILDSYFKTAETLIPGKKFYLFGAYDMKSKYNINNIRRKYKQINRENSGVVPYNTAFKDAQVDSRVIEFIRKNLNSSIQGDNNYFITKTASAAHKILSLSGKKGIYPEEVRDAI